MDRAYLTGAIGTPPTAPAAPSIGYPQGANPGIGVAATNPGTWWYHMITEEIRAVIVAAGLTPDRLDLNQLLDALRSPGVFQTPAQFDATTKAATTDFVQRALGNWAGQTNYAAAQVLTAADIGKIVVAGGNVTLPLASQAAVGARIMIIASGGTRSVSPQGGDTLGTGGDGATVASFAIQQQGFVVVQRLLGSTGWVIYEGDCALKTSPLFVASIAPNGYQKLPSGLIVQWGKAVSSGSGAVTVTFPLAFPTACFSVAAAHNPTITIAPVSVSARDITAINFLLDAYTSNTGARLDGTNCGYIAIGY